MAELVAFGASIVSFIQLTDRVIQLSKFYLEALRDCPHEIRVILVEVSSLKAILQSLSFLIEIDGGAVRSLGLLQQLSGQDGPVEGCRKAIASLEKLLPQDVRTAAQKRRKLEAVISQLAWPLKQSQARKLLDDILRYKTSISFAVTSETSKDVRDIKANLSEVQELLTHEQRQNFCRWIEQTNPTRRHNDSCELHEDHTGGWMIRSSEWRTWLQGSKRFLWIHGIPGAGKTVLASFLIERLKGICHHKRQAMVYYYCYFAHNQDEARPLLRWLIGQLCRKSVAVPREIMGLFQVNHEPSLVQLLQALDSILQEFDTVYVVIDAVDESLPRPTTIKVIRDLATDQRFAKIRVLATSREYIDIEMAFSPISASVSMTNDLVTEDIRVYVHSALRLQTKFANWQQDLLLEVEEALTRGAKGMFRWAVCQIDAIQRMRRQHPEDIRKAIKSLPKTLDETYERIFESIQEDDYPLVQATIAFICGFEETHFMPVFPAVNLLKLVLFTSSSSTLANEQHSFTLADLRDTCGCLLTLFTDEQGLEILELAHYTVKEYLYSDRIARGPASRFALSDSVARRTLATTILTVACQAKGWDRRHQLDNRDLTTFCITGSMEILQICEKDALCDRELQHFYYKFLEPSRPSSEMLISEMLTLEGRSAMIPLERFPRNLDIAIFANLIYAGLPSLAKEFLKTRDTGWIIFRSLIYTCRYPTGALVCGGEVLGRTLIDLFREWQDAHLPLKPWMNRPLNSGDCFSDIVETAMAFYNPTIALLMYLGAHCHSQSGGCRIDEFLKRGADQNALGYRNTPLQIVVWRLDYKALIELLKAGADVNATGDPNGIAAKLPEGMSDQIRPDVTPLSLVRNLREMTCIVTEEIEDLLLDYGAEDSRLVERIRH